MAGRSNNQNAQFFRMMSAVFGVAALVWFGLGLFNVYQGRGFNWAGVIVFALLLAAFRIGAARQARDRP
jgi:hypothetical protein